MESSAVSVVSSKTGKKYYLHLRKQVLRGGNVVDLYFFARAINYVAGTPLNSLPPGYEATENAKTGLPLLRKKKTPKLTGY